ncbi:MAG: hypothetical protein NXI32_21530 [bacterium]|nr:hypothetical protein [bacterium]
MANKKALKWTLQFSVGGLLLLALWFAGSAAGYRNGYTSGYLDGQKKRESEEPYFAKYTLYEKLPTTYDPMDPDYAAFEPILNQLYQNADPDSWLQLGGIGEIVLDPRSTTMAVYNERAVHDEIEAILATMPNNRNLNQPSSNAPAGYSQEAYNAFGRGGGE